MSVLQEYGQQQSCTVLGTAQSDPQLHTARWIKTSVFCDICY